MRRLADWQLRLERFARDRASMPFAWGSNDCACFAADAVEAMTGASPFLARGYSVRYAVRAMRGMTERAKVLMGDPIGPKFARIGDLVLVQVGKRQAFGICNGGTVIGPGRSGIVNLSMAHAVAAWRV